MREPLRRRSPRPLLLATPTRAAALSQTAARWWLAAMLLALLAIGATDAIPIDATAVLIRDGTLIEQLRHGGSFYPVAAETLRNGGESLRPALAFPLPGLPVIVANLPPLPAIGMMVALAALVAMAWQARLAPLCRGVAGQVVLLALIGAGLVSVGRPDLVAVPESWAGLLIALSLARHRPGRWIEATGFGLAAALIAGAAVVYLLVMALLAWRDGEGRETAGWLVAVLLLGVVLGFHVHAVAGVLHPLDMAATLADGTGWTTGLATIAAATAAAALPAGVAAALVMLAVTGWGAWRDPLAIRVAVTIVAIALLLLIGAPAMGGLLVAPVALVGLVFVPDLLRDLAAAALDSRRITVRRSVR